MKSSWMGIGFSHHRVPSLSNTATRSAAGTNSGDPSVVTRSTNSTMACLLAPARQLGSGSPSADAPGRPSKVAAPDPKRQITGPEQRGHLDDHAARLAPPAAVRITRQG